MLHPSSYPPLRPRRYPGLAGPPRDAGPRCPSLERRHPPGPFPLQSRQGLGQNVGAACRAQPGPFPPLARTAPASWGPRWREPRRHAVGKARRCRRLSLRSPAAAATAASPLPPGPERGGQDPGRPRAACTPPPQGKAPLLPWYAVKSVLPRPAVSPTSNAQRKFGKVSRSRRALFSN